MTDPAFGFSQQTVPDIIPDTWILLDSASTVSVFKNRHFLLDIWPSPNRLCVHTNGGTQVSSQVGTVKNFGEVWYNQDSLANILSLASVCKVCRVTMDTETEPAMLVHRKDGSIMKFQGFKSGLYYYDGACHSPVTISTKQKAYLFLNTL